MRVSQKRREDLVIRVVDDELVILDRIAGRVHRFNCTASYIWNACDQRSASEIAIQMAEDFGVPAETMLNDVHATLLEFRRLGLVLDARDEAPDGAIEVTNE